MTSSRMQSLCITKLHAAVASFFITKDFSHRRGLTTFPPSPNKTTVYAGVTTTEHEYMNTSKLQHCHDADSHMWLSSAFDGFQMRTKRSLHKKDTIEDSLREKYIHNHQICSLNINNKISQKFNFISKHENVTSWNVKWLMQQVHK